MGIKQIFEEGLKEFKRRTLLLKQKRELHQKEKVYARQLTALGKKAWESQLDITAYSNLKELIAGSQKQENDQKNQLEEFEKQKQETEEKRKQEDESFDTRRKETEEKKKEVDFRLDKEKKVLKDAQGDTNNANNRLNTIAKEEEQLKRKAADEDTSNIEKTEIQRKLDAFVLEKEELHKKIKEAEKTINTSNETIKPIEEELDKLKKEIDGIRAEQKQVIGDLDKMLSDTRGKINDCNNKLIELNKEQDEYFGQLGEKLAGDSIPDEAVSEELSAARATEREMADIKSQINNLDQSETAASRSSFWKMIWLIVACVVVIIAVIVSLSLLFGSGDKEKSTTGTIPAEIRETKTLSPQVADTIEKYKQKISEAPGQDKDKSSDTPMTMEEAKEKFNTATGELKKRSEQIQGKEIITADKTTLTAALPRISDWEMTEPSYEKQNFGQLENAYISTTYKGPNAKEVKVTIADTASASAMLHSWRIIMQMNITRDDKDGYQKVITVNNTPVIARFDKQRQKGSLAFIVKDRYVVELESTGKESIELLKHFIPKFDLSKLN
jgi:DNA repair exonuclease SbcCD ATPase subunit